MEEIGSNNLQYQIYLANEMNSWRRQLMVIFKRSDGNEIWLQVH